jgi:DNA-directed RNA polymerase specialized sigma24 family protein
VDLDEFSRTGLDPLLRFACALVGDRALAEDIVQEVLIRFFVAPTRPRDVERIDAYARGMVVNEYLSWGVSGSASEP